MAGVIAATLPMLGWIIDASLKGAVLILLMLAVQKLVGASLGARWRHALWMLVLLRLLVPVVPASRLSIFNIFPSLQVVGGVLPAGQRLLEFGTPPGGTAPGGTEGDAPRRPGRARETGELLAAIWIAGFLLLAVRTLVSTLRMSRSIRRQQGDSRVQRIVNESRAALNIRRSVGVVVSDRIGAPAIHGLFRPVLLLPPALSETFAEAELRHIVLHELWHLRRADVAVNWILSFVQIVHWFNPLVWIAAARLREERELCCDEMALSSLQDGERIQYGATILKLLDFFRHSAQVPALVGIVNQKEQMKRRLTMIASFNGRNRFPILFLAIVAVVGTVAFTDARGNERKVMNHMNPASCALMSKLDQKVSFDLTGASIGELIGAIASRTGVPVTQGPDVASMSVQQARFTLHADNVPAHMILMHSLSPFGIMAENDAAGVTLTKGDCSMKMRHEGGASSSSMHKGAHVMEVHINHMKSESSAPSDSTVEVTESRQSGLTSKGNEEVVEKKIVMKGSSSCKLASDGTLHQNISVHFSENGVVSEGKLKLDIDTPASH